MLSEFPSLQDPIYPFPAPLYFEINRHVVTLHEQLYAMSVRVVLAHPACARGALD